MNPEVSHVPADQPGVATAEEGIVLLDGPNGAAIAMTPDADRFLVAEYPYAAGQTIHVLTNWQQRIK